MSGNMNGDASYVEITQARKAVPKMPIFSATELEAIKLQQPTDMVNHPPHYKDGGIEVIDFIEAKRFNYNLGNAVKYISRVGKKYPGTEIQDIEKAIWYLQRELKNLRG